MYPLQLFVVKAVWEEIKALSSAHSIQKPLENKKMLGNPCSLLMPRLKYILICVRCVFFFILAMENTEYLLRLSDEQWRAHVLTRL